MVDAQGWAKFVHGPCPLNLMFLLFLPFSGHPFFGAWILTLYNPSQLILTFYLSIRQVTTRVPVPSATSPLLSVSCNNRSHTVQRSFPINVAETFVGVFNVEVTSFPWTTPTLYPRSSPILLVFSSGSALEAAFDDMSLFPFSPWDAEDRVILCCTSRPFGFPLLVLGNYSPRRGPWALMESGPGPQILWPHNSPLKSCYPDLRTEKRVLMTSGLCQNLSIPVIYQFQRLFVCPEHVLGALEGETCLH